MTWDRDSVVDGVTVEQYVSDAGETVRGGRFKAWWRGSKDRDCSVSISDGIELWHDHGGGGDAGGTVIDLAMTVEKLEFAAACNALGQRYGIQSRDPGAAHVRAVPKVQQVDAVRSVLVVREAWRAAGLELNGETQVKCEKIAANAREIMLQRGVDDDDNLREVAKELVRESIDREATAETDAPPIEADWREMLSRMRGLAGDVARFTFDVYSVRPSARIAIATGLVTAATVYNRSVRDAARNICNLSCLVVCPSGGGKAPLTDLPKEIIQTATAAAGYSTKIMIDGVFSRSGLSDALDEQPVRTMLLGEGGDLFAAVKSSKRRGGSEASLSGALKELATIRDGQTFRGYRGAKIQGRRQREAMVNTPCLNVAAAIQDSVVPAAFEQRDLTDGMLSRFLLFLDDGRATQESARLLSAREIPDGITEAVRRALDSQRLQVGMIPDEPTVRRHGPHDGEAVRVFVYDQDAGAAMAQYAERCEARRLSALDEGRNTAALWARANENAMKVALVLAAGREDQMPRITLDDFALARDIVDACYVDSERFLEARIVDDEFDRRRGQVRNYIKSAGRAGRSRSEITRRQFGDSRTLDRVLEIEIEAGYVSHFEGRPNGRKCETYRITDDGARAC